MKQCLICNNTNVNELAYNSSHFDFLKRTRRNIFDDKKIIACLDCGFSYVYPFIPSSSLENFYSKDYSAYGGPHYEPYLVESFRWKNYLSERSISQIMLARKYVNFSNKCNILDIGCAFGDTFSMLRKMGHEANFFGIEHGKNYINRLEELEVFLIETKDNVVDIDAKYENFFDLIIMSHVLEHFNSNELPEIIEKIGRYLSNDGVLLCEVPNDDNRIKNLELSNQSPHLSFFSLNSLSILLSNHNLSVKYMNTSGNTISKIHSPSINKNQKSIIGSIKNKLYKNKNIKFIIRLIRYYLYFSLVQRWKYFSTNHLASLVSSSQFSYGGNRESIRLIAKKEN